MKLELSSGRVVEIERPSVRDRMRCGDIKVFKFEVKSFEDGRPIVGDAEAQHTKTSAFEYAACGLGVDLDGLDEYSDSEVVEIGTKVEELANLNPANDPS